MPDRRGLGRLPRPLRRRRASPIVVRFSRIFTRLERQLARAGRTTVGGWIAGRVPVLLLPTTGRRSGKPHTTPLLYHRVAGGSLLLIAANGAADWNPDWFHNLAADPSVEVELDGIRYPAQARVLQGGDRMAMWDEALRAFPGLEAAQRESSRAVPLIQVTVD